MSITEIQWSDEQNTSITNNGSVTTMNNLTSGSASLTFSPLQSVHTGIYKCSATIYGSQESKSVNLNVKGNTINSIMIIITFYVLE